MHIILEIVAQIQETAGEDFPIGVRLNIDEQMPGGHTGDKSAIVARVLETTGVKYISSYTGWHESPIPTVAPSLPKGAFVHLAEKIRHTVDIPIIAANRINDPFIAEKIISEGKADLVGMGRALLADPKLPDKARYKRTGEIVPCLACSNCLSEIMSISLQKKNKMPVYGVPSIPWPDVNRKISSNPPKGQKMSTSSAGALRVLKQPGQRLKGAIRSPSLKKNCCRADG